jgi:hypothetical protein
MCLGRFRIGRLEPITAAQGVWYDWEGDVFRIDTSFLGESLRFPLKLKKNARS